ncbi:PIG-L deacetylase family protein [Sutcliffiella horikoshii]|nr:PIG-L family deacetylase [Sutcliffiella horikoshii]
MKKLILLLTIILAGCSATKYDQVDVFYSPHPDDEVLSLGPAIIHALSSSKEVHIVLLSEGKASKGINTVNERLEAEGHPSISTEEFGEARVEEFKRAVEALGVAASNVTILDLPDGKLNKEAVREIIVQKDTMYDKVIYHVMSDKDPHSDHSVTGQALQNLIDEKIVQNGKYYFPVQEHENFPFDNKVQLLNQHQQVRMIEALESYEKWDPSSGNYSIGKISVPEYFITARNNMESRYHYK